MNSRCVSVLVFAWQSIQKELSRKKYGPCCKPRMLRGAYLLLWSMSMIIGLAYVSCSFNVNHLRTPASSIEHIRSILAYCPYLRSLISKLADTILKFAKPKTCYYFVVFEGPLLDPFHYSLLELQHYIYVTTTFSGTNNVPRGALR